jgi:hypothetical protein
MSDASSINGAWDRRRWLILGVIALAQLMQAETSRDRVR